MSIKMTATMAMTAMMMMLMMMIMKIGNLGKHLIVLSSAAHSLQQINMMIIITIRIMITMTHALYMWLDKFCCI